MASTLETLVVRISADASKLEQELNRQVKNAETAGAKIRAGLRLGAQGLAVIGTAATGAATAMTLLVNRTAAYADEVDKAAIRTRLARSTVQELRFVADQAGGSFQAIEANVRAFTGRLAELDRGSKVVAGTFDRLGVSVYDTNGALRDTEALFLDTITALAGVENETERAALAVQAFGETGTELLPILSAGADGIEAMRDKANELGLVLDDQRIGALVQYKDAVSRVGQAFEGVQREISIGFLPVLKDGLLPLLENFLIPRLRDAVNDLLGLESGFDNSGVATDRLRGKLADIAASVVTFGDILLDLGRISVGLTQVITAPFATLGAVIGALSVDLGRFVDGMAELTRGIPLWKRGSWFAAADIFAGARDLFAGTIGAGIADAVQAGIDQGATGLANLTGGFTGLGDMSPGEAARRAVLNGTTVLGGNRSTPGTYNPTGAGNAPSGTPSDPVAVELVTAPSLNRTLEDAGLLPRSQAYRQLGITPFARLPEAVPLGDPGVRAGNLVVRLEAPDVRARVGGAVRLDDPGAFARLLLGDAELSQRDFGQLEEAKARARVRIAEWVAWRIALTTESLREGEDAGTMGRAAFGPFTTGQRLLNDSYQGFRPRPSNPADIARAAAINEQRAEDLRQASEEFRANVVESSILFGTNLVNAFKSGDPSSIFGAVSGGIGSILGLFNPFAGELFSLVGGLGSALIGLGRNDESEATRALGASTRGAPAIELNFTVNQSLNIASLTGSDRRAVDGLLNDTVRALEGVITRNVLPRLGYLEERIA